MTAVSCWLLESVPSNSNAGVLGNVSQSLKELEALRMGLCEDRENFELILELSHNAFVVGNGCCSCHRWPRFAPKLPQVIRFVSFDSLELKRCMLLSSLIASTIDVLSPAKLDVVSCICNGCGLAAHPDWCPTNESLTFEMGHIVRNIETS
jgi:hypothetical protein